MKDYTLIHVEYLRGRAPPHFPVPAVMYHVQYTPSFPEMEEDRPYHNTWLIWERGPNCDCCGGATRLVACVWDYNFDRCCDFFLPLGQYTNRRQLNDGIAAYNARLEFTSQFPEASLFQ